MTFVADTNLVLRYIVRGDVAQSAAADLLLGQCETLIIPTIVFCEVVWVLSRTYGLSSAQILAALEALLKVTKLRVNEDEILAGLRFLKRGGDFADGVIAFIGLKMAASNATFASFDRKAVRLLKEQGINAVIPR